MIDSDGAEVLYRKKLPAVMKKKISFRMWLYVFFGGIRQIFVNIFSRRNKTAFWRVTWAIITLCAVVFTGLLTVAFIESRSSRGPASPVYESELSADLKFHNLGRNKGQSFITDSRTGEKLMEGIDWIAVPMDGDSLIVVAKGGKRGFVNRFTGRTAIPFDYDAAWTFTDGVAGVCRGDSVWFIDHAGRPINNRKFARKHGYGSYVYHGGYAAIPMGEKFGLIDRNGDWAVTPEHDDIHAGPKNMWFVMDDGKYGVIGADGSVVIPMEYSNVWINSDNGITVANADNTRSRYGYDGTLIDRFVFDETHHMAYYIDELDAEGNQKQGVDGTMLKYSVGNFYGLMTKDGVVVTTPQYSKIEAVKPGVYQCEIPDTGDSVMINARGEKIN